MIYEWILETLQYVRSELLQLIHREVILHEVFLSDGPTDSSRIEEGEAIVLAKLF